jgi:DNA repair protein RecO (recombination protein O)
MPLISDRAICVRRYEYSETSQILALFTRDYGVIRVIARGAHRTTKAGASKYDGGLDTLDEGDALFTDRLDKDLNTLAEWKLIDGHRAVRRAQRPLYLALYLAEIVGTVFESHDPHPTAFERFAATLSQLATPALEEAAIALVLDLLDESGFMPSLSNCVGCDRLTMGERALYFSPARGGVACRDCEAGLPDRMQVDPRLVGIATTVARLPRQNGVALRLPRLSRAQTDPLHFIFARHLEHNVGKQFRMTRHVMPTRRSVPSRPVTMLRREAALPSPQTPPAFVDLDASP